MLKYISYSGLPLPPSLPSLPPSLPDQARADISLVGFGREDEEEARPDDESPLPPHGCLIEDFLGYFGDLYDGEEGEDADDDRDEEEAIAEELCGRGNE